MGKSLGFNLVNSLAAIDRWVQEEDNDEDNSDENDDGRENADDIPHDLVACDEEDDVHDEQEQEEEVVVASSSSPRRGSGAGSSSIISGESGSNQITPRLSFSSYYYSEDVPDGQKNA